MANITQIDPTKSISLAPAIINQNFTNLNDELASIASLLSVANNSLTLNNKTAAPANGVEASAYLATAAAGLLFNAIPDGISSVWSVSNTGEMIGLQIMLSAAGLSELGAINVNGAATFKEVVNLDKGLDLSQNDAIIILKHEIIPITPAQIGTGATSPVDGSNKQEMMIDGSNGGAQLVGGGSDATINIDVSGLTAGQILTMRLFKKNSVNPLKFLNGDNTAPLFAKVDFATGYSDIAYTVFPQFDDTVNDDVFMKCQWVEVTAGNFRLVILESKNVLNV